MDNVYAIEDICKDKSGSHEGMTAGNGVQENFAQTPTVENRYYYDAKSKIRVSSCVTSSPLCVCISASMYHESSALLFSVVGNQRPDLFPRCPTFSCLATTGVSGDMTSSGWGIHTVDACLRVCAGFVCVTSVEAISHTPS
jgi:hypothetical protein